MMRRLRLKDRPPPAVSANNIEMTGCLMTPETINGSSTLGSAVPSVVTTALVAQTLNTEDPLPMIPRQSKFQQGT